MDESQVTELVDKDILLSSELSSDFSLEAHGIDFLTSSTDVSHALLYIGSLFDRGTSAISICSDDERTEAMESTDASDFSDF
jgi:hypothetical protein